MNDIVLLMTGVLTTRQASPSNLPRQPVIQLDNSVKNSTRGQLHQLITTAKITPPEFILQDAISSATQLTLKPEYNKTLMKKTEKINAKDTYSLAEFQHFQAVEIKFPHQQRLIAQQQEASFAHQKRLINQQSCDEFVVARAPRYTDRTVPTLSFGSSGLSVKILQRLLVANGYAIRVDGAFGALTESAVKAFQNQRNLAVDGIVGSRTWNALTR